MLYLNQLRRCFVCERRLSVPLAYINKIESNKPYYDNMFISCSICYDLNDDDDIETHEFKNMIYESNFPFNSTSIKPPHNPEADNKLLSGPINDIKKVKTPFMYQLLYGL
jgi:hypothetical protein